MIKVFLPSQLESYTGNLREIELELPAGATLRDVLAELERRYRGLAFRVTDEQGNIRRHIAFFVGDTMVRSLDIPLKENERVQITGALSGG